MLIPMPVSPRITAPLIQPPLGVQSKMLPSLSMIAMCVVSLETPPESKPSDARASASSERSVDAPPCTFAFQYGHVLTLESYLSGSPAINDVDACFGLINAARSLA